jgi:hypothetical protein
LIQVNVLATAPRPEFIEKAQRMRLSTDIDAELRMDRRVG